MLTDVENEIGMSIVEAQLIIRNSTGNDIVDPGESFPTVREQARRITALQTSMNTLDARIDTLENTPILVQTLELDTGWAAYQEDVDIPRVVRKGGVVFLEGTAKNTSALTFTSVNDVYSVTTLPVWARPANSLTVLEQTYSTRIFLLNIGLDGVVAVSRCRDGSGYTSQDANQFWRLNCCWLAADAEGETVDDLEALIERMEVVKDSFDDLKDELVIVDDEEPSSTLNKIWINPDVDEVQVPTYEEFEKAVLIDEQELTDGEQAQARSNISAAKVEEDTDGLVITL